MLTSANSCSAPSRKRRASSTASPAASCARASHWPVLCSAWRKSSSHWLRLRPACRPARRGCTCCTRASVLGTAAQSRSPRRRRLISSAVTASAAKAGAFLSQSSTASVEAFHTVARSRLISAAAARVVESFQPVSSRTATPRPASMACTRRVSCRSCATNATGLRPFERCVNTQAAARCASSSASAAACRANLSGAASGSSGASAIEMTDSPQACFNASVSGSA